MKYVMLLIDGRIKRHVPIIFPDLLAHIDVANAMQDGIVPELKNAKVVSAGDFDVISGEASGRSVSLNIDSREEEDTKIILTYDYLHGIVVE